MFIVLGSKKYFKGLSNIFCASNNRGPENCIDIASTGTSYYDDFLDDKLKSYFAKNKNLEGHIEYMTPLEYYEACAKLFDSTVESLQSQRRHDSGNIDWLSNALESGRKFHLPYINWTNGGQEGLHRMMVIANKYGWDEYTFPVLVVNYIDDHLPLVEEAYRCLSKAIDESLTYKYSIDTLPDYLLSQIQSELDKQCEFTDEIYTCICKSDLESKYILSLEGFEDDIEIDIDKDDIQIREPDQEIDIDNIDIEDLMDEYDFDDIDALLKSLR